jgi:regulatory protein
MASSDDEHLAPVINLFGDRSGAKQTETTTTDPSSEESALLHPAAVEPNTSDLTAASAVSPEVIESPAAVGPAAGADTPPQVETPAPRQSLPTIASFSSSPVQTKAERRQARDGFSEISRVSMRALARRGMSSDEMTQYLGTREFETTEIDDEIERLEGSGLLDDAALAETLAETLRDRKGLGASAIRAELRRRKIDQEHISAVLDVEQDQEQERATEIALKRAPQLRSLDSVTAKRRLTGFLMRKGYSGSIVSAAVTAALAPNSRESSGGPAFR